MCKFIELLEKMKCSSSGSVANREFSDFNKYMHIATQMDRELENVILKAAKYPKALVLVCGNSGDGKSHLIANFIDKGIIQDGVFDVYIDATASDKKGMLANEKLKEKLDPFRDGHISDGQTKRLIVAINLGILNDFLKNSSSEFKILERYIEANSLLDNLPTWKSVKLENEREQQEGENYLITHVDFTEYHRYSLSSAGVGTEFTDRLLAKIVGRQDNNEIYQAYGTYCLHCEGSNNCPVCYNYKFLMEKEMNRKFVSGLLAKAVIKYNLSPSVREINDFFYECIVGNTFNEKKNVEKSTDRLIHYLQNNIFWNLFENTTGLKSYVSKEDALNRPDRYYDQKLIGLYLLPSFEKWLQKEAADMGSLFRQIDADVTYCTDRHPARYRKMEERIKMDVFKLYLRVSESQENMEDKDYDKFVHYLFRYNIGNLDACEELIELVSECFYLWNGKLLNAKAEPINHAVILAQGSEDYCFYKIVELDFRMDEEVEPVDEDNVYYKFSTSIRLGFGMKGKEEVFTIDIDYDLYLFMLKISHGYQPAASERSSRIKFDSFVRSMAEFHDDEICIYSYKEAGRRYRVRKNFMGKYVFEEER